MNQHKICSFFGHSEIEVTDKLTKSLKEFIEWLIDFRGFEIFYFGGFGEFDYLCYEIVSELKEKFPNIKRIYCVVDQRWLRASKRPSYISDSDYEDFIYLDLEFDYWYKCIYYRNVEMINQSDFVIFYVTNTERSGAYKVLKHALRVKKECVNFGELQI